MRLPQKNSLTMMVFTHIPLEVGQQIAVLLADYPSAIGRLGQACKATHAWIDDSVFWARLVAARFGQDKVPLNHGSAAKAVFRRLSRLDATADLIGGAWMQQVSLWSVLCFCSLL